MEERTRTRGRGYYRQRYRKLQRTKLEKICIYIQIIAGIFLVVVSQAQMAYLSKAGSWAMTRSGMYWLIAYLVPIFILIVTAVIRVGCKSRRETYNMIHQTTSKYREEFYIMTQLKKEEAMRRHVEYLARHPEEKTAGNNVRIAPRRTKNQRTLIAVGWVCAAWIGLKILRGLVSFTVGFMVDQTDVKAETGQIDYSEYFENLEKLANESAESTKKSGYDMDMPEAESAAGENAEQTEEGTAGEPEMPAEEGSAEELSEEEAAVAAAGAGTENRDDFTDEEWFLTTVKVGIYDLPHGFTEKDTEWDKEAYWDAGGSSYSLLQSRLAKNLTLWAEKKETVEGSGYWADGHIKGIDDNLWIEVQSVVNRNLQSLNPKAIVRYTEEVMDSSIWEELRSYVGDEEADKIDQEMNELIQKEEEIFAKMAEARGGRKK